MKILAIGQHFDNKALGGQKGQQNVSSPSMTQMPKSDAVSFGMSNKVDIAKLRATSKKLVQHITSGKTEEAKSFIIDLLGESDEFKKAFALLRDKDLDTHFNIALVNKQPQVADTFIEFVQTLDTVTQKKFALLKGSDEISQFEYAQECKYPESALKFLDFAAGAAPKEAIKFKVPEELTTSDSFVSAAEKIAVSTELLPAQKLAFLKQNNKTQRLNATISKVEKEAA